MNKAKIFGKWNSPDEEYIRKYCIGYTSEEQIQERLKLTHSISIECTFCGEVTWQMITLNQEKGKEAIKCIICNQLNFI